MYCIYMYRKSNPLNHFTTELVIVKNCTITLQANSGVCFHGIPFCLQRGCLCVTYTIKSRPRKKGSFFFNFQDGCHLKYFQKTLFFAAKDMITSCDLVHSLCVHHATCHSMVVPEIINAPLGALCTNTCSMQTCRNIPINCGPIFCASWLLEFSV